MRIKSLLSVVADAPLAIIHGRPVWAINGAADDDSTDDGGTEDANDDADADEGSDDEEKPEDTGISREEFDRLKARMQAADRRATAAENKVRDFENQGKSELEKVTAERDAAVKARDDANEALTQAKMENAFYSVSNITWHDPQDAFRLADFSAVEIGDDGAVSGMESAAKALAKAKPHLVKKEVVTPATEATGSTHNGKRKGAGDDDAALKDRKRRFPQVYGRS